MPLIAECRECGKQYRLRDDLAGSLLPCKACGADFRVPSPNARPARAARRPAPRSAPVDDFDDRDNFGWEDPDDNRSSNAMTFWLIGGGSIAVVIIGVIVGIAMFSGKKDNGGDAEQVAQNEPDNPEPVNPQFNNPVIPNAPENNGGLGNRNRNLDPGRRNPRNRFGGQPAPPGQNNPGNLKPIVKNPENLQPANNPGNLQPAQANPPPQLDRKPGNIVRGNDPLKTKVPRTTRADWSAKPDPPAEEIVFQKKGKIIVKSPARSGGDAIYPSVNSAFVAVGSNRDATRDYRIVQDLRNNKKIGEIRGLKLFFSKGVLSPDGTHFAVFSRDAKAIILYDVRAGRSLGTLPIPDEKAKNAFRLEVLDFSGPNRLVAAGRNTPLWVWSVPSGKAERSIPLPERYSKDSITFSPGGRYMTVFSNADSRPTVHAIDLTTGNQAGSITMPKEFGSWTCFGMAFSPDGTQLAGMLKVFQSSRVYCWNFADGNLMVAHAFEKDPQFISKNYKGPAVQWFPDKSRWLAYGNYVVDRESGKTVWTVPKIEGSTHDTEARLLGSDRIALVGRQGRVTALATLDVSLTELEKATKLVQSGGTQADVKLPPLKVADESTAKRIPIEGVAGKWSMTADPAPKAVGKLIPASMQVGAGLGTVKALELSRADSAIAIVASEGVRRGGIRPGEVNQTQPELRLDRYDVAAGKLLDSYDVTFKSTFLAISPSGKRAAVRYKTGEDRVDVFALDGKTPVTGFRPYQNEKSDYHKKVAGAFFVDDDHLLTISSNHKIVLWKLSDCSAVYVIENAKTPSFSPGGRYLAVSANKSCRFFNARTGDPVGDLHLDALPRAAAFHPNGEKAAVMFMNATQMEMAIVNLRDGKMESRFAIPMMAETLEWAGDKHVLMNGKQLVDLNAKAVVWTYQLARGAHAPVTPDGRHWYVVDSNPITLNAVQLPDPETTQRLAGKDLAPKMILKPGMKVSLNVQLNGISTPNLANEITREWTKKLEQGGLTVAPGQPVTLFARADSTNTGKSVTFKPTMFSRFGRAGNNNRGEEVVQQTVVNCRIVFGFNGKSYRERKSSVSNVNTGGYFGQRVRLNKGESVTTHLRNAQSKRAGDFFRYYFPPNHVFAPESMNGLGYSQLTAGGARPLGN